MQAILSLRRGEVRMLFNHRLVRRVNSLERALYITLSVGACRAALLMFAASVKLDASVGSVFLGQ